MQWLEWLCCLVGERQYKRIAAGSGRSDSEFFLYFFYLKSKDAVMSAKITVQPSGHTFVMEEGETILEGALRSGLNMNYHCSNGSCGECKGRVISGELAECLHHDYVLSAADKAERRVLLCRARAGTDMTIEAGEAHGVEDIPVQTVETTVAKLEQPVEDIMILNLRTPRSSTLRFLAGQHVTLHVDGQNPRNKSIASCPCNGMMLQFHVHRTPGDPFSDFVFSGLKQRQKIRVEGPYGDFLLDEESVRPIIYIAFETGFAPVKSLIEHAIALEMPQPMQLYWIARSEQDHYMANYCRAWQDALDDFEFHSLVSAGSSPMVDSALAETGVPAGDLCSVEKGMLQAAAEVVADIDDISGYDVYVNGPENMLDQARAVLLQHGLSETRLFVDHVRRY